MLRLALWLLGLGGASGLTACERGPAAAAPAGEPAAVRALLALADETCACSTDACAEAKTKAIFDGLGALLGNALSTEAAAKDGVAVRKAVQRAAVCKAKLARSPGRSPVAPPAAPKTTGH